MMIFSMVDRQNTSLQTEKTAKLKINDSIDFCRIESIKYKYEGGTCRQHYVIQVNGDTDVVGNLGIRSLDELLEVNGEDLRERKQKYVMDVFKRIKPAGSSGDILLRIRLRRWNSAKGVDDDTVWVEDIQLTLAEELVPNKHVTNERTWPKICGLLSHRKAFKRQLSVKHMSTTVINKQKLPPGNIEYIRIGKEIRSRHIKIEGTAGEYISMMSDGLLVPTVLKSSSECLFNFQLFYGRDSTPKGDMLSCVRIYANKNATSWFLCSDLDNIIFKPYDNDSIADNIDERCFIKRSIGSLSFYHSLVHRDRVMYFDRERKTFTMKVITEVLLETFINGQNDREVRKEERYVTAKRKLKGCWFNVE